VSTGGTPSLGMSSGRSSVPATSAASGSSASVDMGNTVGHVIRPYPAERRESGLRSARAGPASGAAAAPHRRDHHLRAVPGAELAGDPGEVALHGEGGEPEIL